MDGTDSGWQELPKASSWTGGAIRYKRIGNIFILKNTSWAKCADAIAVNGNSLVGTIPSEDRPGTVIGYAMRNGSGNPLHTVKIESGQVRLYNNTSDATAENANFLFNVIAFLG